jgi:hypothetical protein
MTTLNEKYGLWVVGDKTFDNKYQALVHASTTNQNIKFWYHNEKYDSVDRKLLGKIPLNTLYKERAQQLRDTYDYLILYYSGGADSHNILKTFIDNDIFLDEICVKWPKPLIDSKFYNPNSIDKSSKNIWSEWNYCVEPILKWLATHRPKTKIHIKDYTENIDKIDIDKFFVENPNHGFRASIIKDSQGSDSENEQMRLNKTVASIYGIDKPLLLLHNNNFYTFFSDNGGISAGLNINNPYGIEYFYWSPDMPILALEQAFQLSIYYKTFPELQKIVYTYADIGISKEAKAQSQNDIIRKVIYDNWDNRFQAEKTHGKGTSVNEKYFWLFDSELNNEGRKIISNIIERTSTIDKRFLSQPNSEFNLKGKTVNEIPNVISSKLHYINSV